VFELRIPVRVLTADEVAAVTAAQEELAAAAAEDARAARHRVSAAAAAAADDAAVLASPCSSTSSGGSTKSHFHVLLADDHMLNLRLVSRLLQLQGFDVTAVADGSTALDVLRSDALAQVAGSVAGPVSLADAVPFDLAILDMSACPLPALLLRNLFFTQAPYSLRYCRHAG
jgi:PleD family two-component response regulator